MNQPLGYPVTPPPKSKKRPAWKVGGATILSFVALLYVIELVDQLSDHSLDRNGIRPLETDGLWGILFAPLLHANWEHLVANTVPALVLGFLVTLAGMSRFVWATAIIWILGGLGTWLIGNIGAAAAGDQPHRRLRADLRLADVPARVRLVHPPRLADRHRRWSCSFVYGGVLWGAMPGSTAAAGCPGRAICAGPSPACWPPTGCPARNARPGQRKKAGATAGPDVMSDRFAPVGIFDSGVGGLTVARSIIDQLPDEDIVYVGDTANGPYGPLTHPRGPRPRPGDRRRPRRARRQGARHRLQHRVVGLPARRPRTLRRARRRGDPAGRPPRGGHHPHRAHRGHRHPGHHRLRRLPGRVRRRPRPRGHRGGMPAVRRLRRARRHQRPPGARPRRGVSGAAAARRRSTRWCWAARTTRCCPG